MKTLLLILLFAIVIYGLQIESFKASPLYFLNPANKPAGNNQFSKYSQTDLNPDTTSYLPGVSSQLSNKDSVNAGHTTLTPSFFSSPYPGTNV